MPEDSAENLLRNTRSTKTTLPNVHETLIPASRMSRMVKDLWSSGKESPGKEIIVSQEETAGVAVDQDILEKQNGSVKEGRGSRSLQFRNSRRTYLCIH